MSRIISIIFVVGFMYLQFVASGTRKHCNRIRCGNARAPVCGADGRTYRSMCHFIKTLCRRKKPVHLLVKKRGYCRRSFVCSLPKEVGRCNRNRKRYYFNKHKKRCLPFRYRGCYGNGNNFPSYKACKRFCGKYALFDELDDYERPVNRLRQEPTNRYSSDMFYDEENEDNIDNIGDDIVNRDEDQDEDEGRLERRLRDGENELEEDELMEEENPVDEEEEDPERDRGDGDEENVKETMDDEDDALENETEYIDQAENEKEAAEETKNRIASIADPSKSKLSTKSTYASCERGMCELNITPVGCFRDSHKKVRPLPHLVDSHRDTTSHAYHGTPIDWKNFESTIRRLACDCVKIARKRNYTHIGLQNYGECWAGNVTSKEYAIDGKSDGCVNGTYKPCEKGKFCIGKQKTNFVYKIEPNIPDCHVAYEKVGCFHDPVKTDKRPMPELLDSHRDRTSNSYHGLLLDWKNYRTSLKILIDHCAKRTKSKGYSYFGIQHYGECWSGDAADRTYSMYGNSTNCVNADYEKCNSDYACQCTGKENANFVYRLK